MIDKLKTTEGKWNRKKLIALFMVPVTMWVLNTWYGRYAFLRDQAYRVQTVEKSMEKLEKSYGVLHRRISEEQNKRESKDEVIMKLIFDMLKHQQNQIQLQQKQLEKETK